MEPAADTPLENFSWVPAARCAALKRLGLRTLRDLLFHFPRRHEDRRQFDRLPEGDSSRPVCLQGRVVKVVGKRFGGWKKMVEAIVENEGGGAFSDRWTCRWFNAHYIQKMLFSGDRVVVFGKTKTKGNGVFMDHPEFEVIEEDGELSLHFDAIVPVHPAGEGVTPKLLRSLVHRALEEPCLAEIESIFPEGNAGENLAEALRSYHFPPSWEALENARRRLVTEEFFELQSVLLYRREAARTHAGTAKRSGGKLFSAFCASLPFTLTDDQKKCVEEIRSDLRSPHPMQRLLQGDVGTGKTAVATATSLDAIEAGWQVAFMAPTQILAEQHYKTIRNWLEPLKLRVGLQTAARREIGGEERPCDEWEEVDFVVGTHALLYEKTRFRKLGMVIIDEQHKFGVLQRARLLERGDSPDLLVMTATPIPRTLTQTLHGDLDVSLLRQRPANRGRIVTAVRPTNKLPEITKFLCGELAAGRQAYIVYPLIEESETAGSKAAVEESKRWEKALAPFAVGLLHGRMKPEEKDRVMDAFRAKELAALVATTVIEVGVDVPNATVMLVENAERFGLAQLHQLRGRVGRGPHKSWCILVHGDDAQAAKLSVLENSEDGFEIAEADWQLRGPGDLVGAAQSGLPRFSAGDLVRDASLMEESRKIALSVFGKDPQLVSPKNAALRNRLEHLRQEQIRLAGG